MTQNEFLKNLQNHKLSLPEISTPGGNYSSVNIRGNIAYVAIQFPILNGDFLYLGKYGAELSTEDGYEAAQLSALNVLAQISSKVGIENLEGLNHFDLYYQSVSNWDDAPKIANGASDLFVNILGDLGTHSRAIIGAESLPKNLSVGLVCNFTILG